MTPTGTSSQTRAPQLLNTPYFGVRGAASPVSVKQYFDKTAKLGSYSIIEVTLAERGAVQIVVDQDLAWIHRSLEKFLGRPVGPLTLIEIRRYIDHLRDHWPTRLNVAEKLGLAPHRDPGQGRFHQVFYLDEISQNDGQKPLVLALITQILIEKFTKQDSRIALIREERSGTVRRAYVVLIRKGEDFEIYDPMNVLAELNGRTIREVAETISLGLGADAEVEVLHNDFRVLHPEYSWSEKNKAFSVINGYGRELLFSVAGRTPTERRFKQEMERIRGAQDEELVPIEIGFHPFYRALGHTSIRIGEALYELTSKGWRGHCDGHDSPRAFLYNNPFFRKQYSIFGHKGMPPISLAATILVPKRQADELSMRFQKLVMARGWKKERFWLFFNNCNQGIMRVLEQAGVPGFTEKGYLGFSSILSFRRLLLEPKVKVEKLYIYPLPGSEINESNLRRWVPRLLYRHNTPVMEVFRAIPVLFTDMSMLPMINLRERVREWWMVSKNSKTGPETNALGVRGTEG